MKLQYIKNKGKNLSVVYLVKAYYSANIYLFKINNRNTRKRCEIISSKLTIKKHQRDV